MKKALVIAAIALALIWGAAFLFIKGNRETNEAMISVCQSFSIGQKIGVDAETKRIESLGLHVTTSVAGEAGRDHSMVVTASGFEPALCEIQIRDGSVSSIK